MKYTIVRCLIANSEFDKNQPQHQLVKNNPLVLNLQDVNDSLMSVLWSQMLSKLGDYRKKNPRTLFIFVRQQSLWCHATDTASSHDIALDFKGKVELSIFAPVSHLLHVQQVAVL